MSNQTEHAITPGSTTQPSTDHLDGENYLFGYPIAHSRSPLLHGTIYKHLGLNYAQQLYESKSLTDCLALTNSPKFYGASVTMPHKVAIIPYLDVLTAEGEAIGAVNTIFLRTSPDGKRQLCGTNTDCIGIREALVQNVPPATVTGMQGRPGMVIGGGGTCRAAIYALKRFIGCSTIYLVNRDKSECDLVIAECLSKGFGQSLRYISSVSEAMALEAPGVVVSAIPDFEPQSVEEKTARSIVTEFLSKKEGALLEMCYHPSSDTQITRLALEKGWQVVPGVEAMIWQGLEQDSVWLEREVKTLPINEVKEAIARALEKPRL